MDNRNERAIPANLTVKELTKKVETDFLKLEPDALKQRLDDEMGRLPGLSSYIKGHMAEGLIPQEEVLIGSTALAVFEYCDANNIKPGSPDPGEEMPKISQLPLIATVIDDDGLLLPEDKNRIFNYLQEDMREHTELAGFIVSMMGRSVSLQEANIIGRTALTTYLLITYPFVK